ncbi:hypothetical protein [Flavimobilis marinus]|nr:hypothetical protein [Flavimobilis marinus]
MSASAFKDSRPAEVEGARSLERLFARLDTAESRSSAFKVRHGSLLAGDDRATAYDPVSYQVRYLFMAAFDHLGMLKRALDKDGMPVVAAYPLVRAALESAAQALWLTTGGTRRKRVFRALHRVWNGASLSDEAVRHLDPRRESSLLELRERLDQLLSASKAGQRSLDVKYPSMTDIVIDAGRAVETHEFRPIDVWRLCSSMAHGNRSVSLMVLESRPDGPTTDIGGNFVMTTSYQVMAAFVGVVTDLLEAAIEDQDRLNA